MVTRLPISARVAVSSSEYRPSAVACAIEFIPISFWYDVPLTPRYRDRRHNRSRTSGLRIMFRDLSRAV